MRWNLRSRAGSGSGSAVAYCSSARRSYTSRSASEGAKVCGAIPGVTRTYAVVSCHVERPLDDRTWAAFSRLPGRRPGGFTIAALMRPPDRDAGESEGLWIARARIAARRGPLGHHTHWGGPEQARPRDGDPAERVRREGAWLRENGLGPTLFCGGGWYMDEGVAAAAADLGYADCTATAFRPRYLEPGAPRLSLSEPARLRVRGGTLLELPSTHSLGMAARSALGRLPGYVHVYFHDADLLDTRRRLALEAALAVLGRRRSPARLDRLSAEAELDFSSAVSSP